MSISIVQGPPGTGKTTHLSQIVQALVADGVEPSSIAIFSLTRTAAYAASSKIDLPEDNIGTVHKFARRAERGKEPADSWQGIKKFNSWLTKKGKSQFYLSPGFNEDEDAIAEETNPHNVVMAEYMRLRAMLDFDAVAVLRRDNEVIRLWEQYKSEKHIQDFEDWIYGAATSPAFNGTPSTITHLLVDEAQDCSPSEKRLIDAWSKHVAHVYIVGDPMQALYRFRGASPLQFFSPNDLILKQSYRLPGNPCAFAKLLAPHCPEYIPQEYHAKVQSRQGIVDVIQPYELVYIAEHALKNKLHAMFLASTGYGCEVYRDAFLDRGIPFRNEYRPRSTRWNPMSSKAATLFKSIMNLHWKKRKYWTVAEMKRILTPINETHVLPGTLVAMEKMDFTNPARAAEYLVFNKLVSKDFKRFVNLVAEGDDWLDSYLDMLSYQYRAVGRWMKYFSQVYDMEGIGPFTPSGEPAVTVGTCHSVKGGEADIVVLSDAITKRQIEGDYSDLIRIFYVGATRTRDRLYLLNSDDKLTLPALWSAYNEYTNQTKREHAAK